MRKPSTHRQFRAGRFALVLGPAAAIMVGMFAGIAQGVIPVSFAVSGDGFKIAADDFKGTHFQQFGSIVKTQDGKAVPVAMTAVAHADLDHLCQTIAMKLPLINKTVVLKITAGDNGTPASADDMIIAAAAQRGDATFTNMKIGIDASTVDEYPALKGSPGAFALESDTIDMKHLQQDSMAVTAGTFTLTHLNLSVNLNNTECY
jgi:hypothetical protein